TTSTTTTTHAGSTSTSSSSTTTTSGPGTTSSTTTTTTLPPPGSGPGRPTPPACPTGPRPPPPPPASRRSKRTPNRTPRPNGPGGQPDRHAGAGQLGRPHAGRRDRRRSAPGRLQHGGQRGAGVGAAPGERLGAPGQPDRAEGLSVLRQRPERAGVERDREGRSDQGAGGQGQLG